MLTPNSPQQSSLEEQIQRAENKYQQLLKEDVEFMVLKQLKNEIRRLKEQLDYQYEGLRRFISN